MRRLIIFVLMVCTLVMFSACNNEIIDSVSANKQNDDSGKSETITGYIRLNGNSIEADEFEFITQEDKNRISELSLSLSADMPNGYYINNTNESYEKFELSDNAEFIFYDTGNLFVSEDDDKKYITSDIEEFHEFLYGSSAESKKTPFKISVKDKKVEKIEEIFIN
ncbi:MAG: hypothetical protein HFE90_09575 [Firmicutes bacterium]|nr:hypothetical protein [Bacillota bacterium]